MGNLIRRSADHLKYAEFDCNERETSFPFVPSGISLGGLMLLKHLLTTFGSSLNLQNGPETTTLAVTKTLILLIRSAAGKLYLAKTMQILNYLQCF